jgi:NitT/TauT family transport system permease protein
MARVSDASSLTATEPGSTTTPGNVFEPVPQTNRLVKRLRGLPWQPVVSLTVAALLWQFVLPRLGTSTLVPSIDDVYRAWFTILEQGRWSAILVTMVPFAIGTAIAAVSGILVGVAAARWRTFDYIIQPYVTLFMAIPITALVPVLLLVFGVGSTTRILVVFLYAFFVIVINVQSGMLSINPSYVDMANAFNASPRQRFFMVMLPSSLPWIATGVRLGIAKGLKGTINAEVIIRSAGLGYLLLRYTETFDLASVLAVVVTIVLLVIGVMQLVNWVEKKIIGRNV